MQITRNNKKKFKLSTVIILLFVAIFLFIIFSLSSRDFITYKNLSSMLRNMVIIGLLSLGLTPLMIAGGIDISFGSSISLTSLIIAILYNYGLNIFLSITIGIIFAIFIGAINGILIEVFDLIPLLLTIGTLSILQAFALIISNTQSVAILDDRLYFFATKSFLKIPYPLFILIFFILAYWLILNFTKTGKTIYAIGGNPKVSLLFGIKVKKVKILLYLFMGLATGVAAVVQTALSGVGYPTLGQNLMMPSLSAVLIGGISLDGGKGTVLGTILGVFIMAIVFNGLSMLNVPTFFVQLLQGVTLLVIVTTYEVKNRKTNLKY